ncbi:hypothetical protein SS50377_27807 [Spironucleus salmonicida]|uniref:Uncharacterized protein n=1 Tax=Spironucleus salmonicida TaxID=348837 RepID=V6LX95_9EUKA|nr:hypothetical protein SS50377_27807 [Spironucleus salmonicida]|eukprot:EST48873.1 Hypothetical protein SS50377_10976 [Spironucleus salmonicida]
MPPHSISLSIQGEPIQIVFESFQMAVKVAKILQEHLSAESQEQVSSEIHAELSLYTREICAYKMAQPLFVEGMSNTTDFRILLPQSNLCRTFITTEIMPVQEVLNLQKQTLQPQPLKLPPMLPPMLPPPQNLTFQQQKPPHMIQSPQPTQTPQPPPQQNNSQHVIEDQLFKPIQTLILLCSKNHTFISEMVNQTGVAAVSNDKDSIQKLCKVAAEKILQLPIDQQIKKIRGIPFEGELKEKVIEILQKVQKPQIKPPVIVPVMQVPVIKKEVQQVPFKPHIPQQQQPQPVQTHQPTVNQTDDKVKQVMSVLKQLSPDAVSKLLHGQLPSQLPIHGSVGYRMSFKAQEMNTIRFKEKERSSIQESQLQGILTRVLQVWNANIIEKKAKTQLITSDNQLFREKILKLYERSQDMHQKCVNDQEMKKFHQQFNYQENLMLLLKVKGQLKSTVKIYDFQQMQSILQQQQSVKIFEQLKSIVEKHKGIPQSKPQQQPPPQQIIQHNIPPNSPPITTPFHPPVISQPISSPPSSQKPSISAQHQQILDDVQKTQEKLERPTSQIIQQQLLNVKPIVNAKLFVTILGLGYQYHHLFLLEQNLLEKQLDTLKSQLNLDNQPHEIKSILDILLRTFISFISQRKNDSRYVFTPKQKPQLIRIQPQNSSSYDVSQFYHQYQLNSSKIRSSRNVDNKDINYYHQSSLFQIFEKHEILEIFQGINVFGDLLDDLVI